MHLAGVLVEPVTHIVGNVVEIELVSIRIREQCRGAVVGTKYHKAFVGGVAKYIHPFRGLRFWQNKPGEGLCVQRPGLAWRRMKMKGGQELPRG